MPSTYTLNNGIELIGTGEQSGTWGDTTNTNLQLLDTALDGQITVTLASAGTSGSPNTLSISDGTTSDGRNRMIIFADSGDLGATAYVQLTPNDAEKIIYIRNNLSGSRSILFFQGTYNASNDYEVPAGTTAVIYFDGAGTGAVAANVFNNAYFDSLRLGSVSVTAILDEDNMASDSATALATQQSIKAYVDTQVGANNELSEVLANGNTSGGNAIQMTTTDELQFRDTALKISSSADGQLDIDADTEIEIVAPTVDIDASTAMTIDTAALTVTGAVDFNTSLNVDGTVTSDGLTVAGNVSVDGGTIKLDGNYPDQTDNVALGNNALDALTAGGSYNTAIGANSLTENTSGDLNVAVGSGSLSANTTGAQNTGVGTGALAGNSTGSYNTAFGRQSLLSNTTASGNTMAGYQAGYLVGDEIVATAIVSGVNYTIQTLGTTDFTLIGAGANTVGTTFTATGAGTGTGTASANANYNTFVGYQAGDLIVGGSKNSILGSFDGNQGGLDIRNSNNHIVLSDGDGNPRLYIDGSGNMAVDTNTLYVDATNNRVGIGLTGPAQTLHLKSADPVIRLEDSSPDGIYAQIDGAGGGLILSADGGAGSASSFIGFRVDGTALVNEAMRIDSSQRVLIGTDTARSTAGHTSYLQVEGSGSFSEATVSIVGNENNSNGSYLNFGKSRGTTAGSNTIVQDGDVSGQIQFTVADGQDMVSRVATITAKVDGAPSLDDTPGLLDFATTAVGGSDPTLRMRILSSGDIGIGTANPNFYSGYTTLTINGTSGGLLDFETNGTFVGEVYADSTDGIGMQAVGSRSIKFVTDSSNAMIIDSDQRVSMGAGTNAVSTITNGWWNGSTLYTGILNVQNVNDGSAEKYVSVAVSRHSNDAEAGQLGFAKSRGATANSKTTVGNGDTLGAITFQGADGVNLVEAARISAITDGTASSDDMPGRLMFYTTADGASASTERMRISQNGFVNIGGQRTADESLVELNKSGSDTVGEGHIGFASGADPLWAIRFGSSDFDFRLDRSYAGWNSAPSISVRRSNGYVGLGVDTASYQLDVQNTANTFSRVLATNNSTRAAYLAQAHLSDGTDINMTVGVFGDANQGEISMATGHPLLLYTNNDPTKGVEIQVDGDLNIKDGNLVVASGHGIDFSATSGTGTSELLDDYEEGTFTPVVADAASGGNEGSATEAYGYYTKTGRQVTVQITLLNIDTTGLTGANDLYITGVPFAAEGLSGINYFTGSMSAALLTSSADVVVPEIFDSSSYVRIREWNLSGTGTDWTIVSELTSGTADLNITLTYFAA